MTVCNTAKVMASINNLVIALIHQANFQNVAQAGRWFAAHLSEAFAFSLPLFPDFGKAMNHHKKLLVKAENACYNPPSRFKQTHTEC